MHKSDAVRLKAYSSVRIGTRCPVFEIPLDGASHVGELAAYLVMAAGEQFDLQEMITLRVGYVPVAQLREFGPGPRLAEGKTEQIAALSCGQRYEYLKISILSCIICVS